MADFLSTFHKLLDLDELPEGRVTTVNIGHHSFAVTLWEQQSHSSVPVANYSLSASYQNPSSPSRPDCAVAMVGAKTSIPLNAVAVA
jgi:hypothetical protein